MRTSIALNFLKVALRNIVRSSPHSYINIAGLIIGFSIIILISAFVFYEFSFDKFHKDYDRIYRVNNSIKRGDTELNSPACPPALGPSLATDFPEIEAATRIRYSEAQLIRYNEVTNYETLVFYADSSFFKIFDFEFMLGNPLTALNQPNSIVINEKMAQKYFGRIPVLDEMLILDGNRPLKVTGVIKSIPQNSHFDFDMLISFQTFRVSEGSAQGLDSWSWLGFINYVKVHESVNIPLLERKIENEYKAKRPVYAEMNLKVSLQNLSQIYLGSSEIVNKDQIFRVNSYTSVYSLMVVGLLIIIIAFINYVNLSTAISLNRYKETAVRKVLGSSKGKLILQFTMESVLYVMVALMLAFFVAFLAQSFLPYSISSKLQLRTSEFLLLGAFLFLFAILIGIISGIFPAVRLSSTHSLDLLKGSFRVHGNILRNALIGFQFALSGALITVSLIIGKQVEFFLQKELGFKENGIISININSDQFNGKAGLLQSILGAQREVKLVSQSNHIMGEGLSGGPIWLKEKDREGAVQVAYFQADYNFASTMELELTQGRFFSEQFHGDSTGSIVLNEKAVSALGLSNPIGHRVMFMGQTEKEIVGIIKDFHFASLHDEISPMAIVMPFTYPKNLIVSLERGNIHDILDNLESAWKGAFPDLPFEVRFLDSHLQSLYEKEMLLSTAVQFFTALSAVIACLGLYSLAAILLASKLRQISIRRVYGASAKDILILNGKGFLFLVLIASIISWPIAWYTMHKWLDNFAYRIELDVSFFMISLIAILGITLLTISYHLLKATTVNPAKILREKP